jgi:hypothetical protein
MVDLYEQVTEPDLQDFLAARLLRRAGLFPQSFQPDEVTRMLREALGAKDPVSGRQRWRNLSARYDEVIPPTEEAAEQERLQALVDIAHLGTEACALAQGEVGYATFDELQERGPTRLSDVSFNPATPGSDSQRRPRFPRSVVNSIVTNIQELNSPRNRQRSFAPVYLSNLAQVASEIPALPREAAEGLARYLLSPKNDRDHQAVLQHVEALTRWHNVRLGLADGVLETRLSKERIVEVFSEVLGRQLVLNGGQPWRERLRELVIRDVIAELEATAPREDGADRIYDDLREALRELYSTRARLLGVSADEYASASTPSEVLQQLIATYAANLNSTAASDTAAWSEQLVAIDYAAEDDIQRTVLLQRLWLQVLASGLIQQGTVEAGQAGHLLAELDDRDRQPGDVVGQLYAGEKTQLEMLLLTKPTATAGR